MAQTDTTKVLATRLGELTEAMRDTDPKMSNAKQAKEMGIPYSTFNKYLYNTAECSISTITIIADYYGVSVDYLLGRTDVKTTNTDIKAICEYTGLSEESVEWLNDFSENELIGSYRYSGYDDICRKVKTDVLSYIFTYDFLYSLADNLLSIAEYSEEAESYIDLRKLRNICKKLGFDEDSMNKVLTIYHNRPKDYLIDHKYNDAKRAREIVETLRYKNIRITEELNDLFDHKDDYLSYSKNELFVILKKATEEDKII